MHTCCSRIQDVLFFPPGDLVEIETLFFLKKKKIVTQGAPDALAKLGPKDPRIELSRTRQNVTLH